MPEAPQAGERGRYAIGDLARLAGVSRRTIRYYLEEGLLDPPLGRGRGRNYDERHLRRILQIRTLQEQGLSLSDARRALRGAPAHEFELEVQDALTPASSPRTSPAGRSRRTSDPHQEELFVLAARASGDAGQRSAWTRLEIAPGLELHVSGEHRMPPPGRLRELAHSCARAFGLGSRDSESPRA